MHAEDFPSGTSGTLPSELGHSFGRSVGWDWMDFPLIRSMTPMGSRNNPVVAFFLLR